MQFEVYIPLSFYYIEWEPCCWSDRQGKNNMFPKKNLDQHHYGGMHLVRDRLKCTTHSSDSQDNRGGELVQGVHRSPCVVQHLGTHKHTDSKLGSKNSCISLLKKHVAKHKKVQPPDGYL